MKSPLVSARPGAAAIAPAGLDHAVRVHDRIYMSTGTSNCYLVLTAAGNVLINSGMGFEAPRHQRLFAAVSRAPLRYIILTQGHVDHVGGVDQFKEPGTVLIAQRANPACQADDERIAGFRQRRSFIFFRDIIRAAIAALREHPGAAVQSKPRPDVLVDDHHAFELGDLRFDLFAVPGGETVDALVVWLPAQRIAFVGNQFGALFPHFPNLYTVRGDKYRFVIPYLESLERVRALEPEMLITGHFEPIVGRELIQREICRLRDAVRFVHDATVAGMNAGTDVYRLMRDIRLPPDLEVGEGYGKVAWAVRTIVESYGGWFHGRSTTELYATPVTEVYGDVVALAGGADAVAARAAARLAGGEPLHAIHIAEIALADAPQHRRALETLLAAHERLLAESHGDNFWETGWLRHQIANTRRTLGLPADDV